MSRFGGELSQQQSMNISPEKQTYNPFSSPSRLQNPVTSDPGAQNNSSPLSVQSDLHWSNNRTALTFNEHSPNVQEPHSNGLTAHGISGRDSTYQYNNSNHSISEVRVIFSCPFH